MRAIFIAAFLTTLSSAAFAFPPQCTANYGYSAACCAASYGRDPEGTVDNGRRHAALAACSEKQKEKGPAKKKH